MTQGRFNAFDLSRAGARHRGVATLAALALLAAGCGGGNGGGKSGGERMSKSEYEARIQHDGKEIRDVFKPLSTPPSSLDALASAIKKGQNKLRDVAADLDGVTPPANVEHDNDVLVSGLRKLADQLEPLRQGAAKGDVRAVQKAVNEIQGSQSLKGAQEATADMKKKGYKIGALGR
jgi:hypothetical protein